MADSNQWGNYADRNKKLGWSDTTSLKQLHYCWLR